MSIGSIGSATTVSTDPRDKNGDGKVSAAEAQAYALAHPDPKKVEAKPSTGTEQTQSTDSVKHLLDVSA